MRPYSLRTVGEKGPSGLLQNKQVFNKQAHAVHGAGGHSTSTASHSAFCCLTITSHFMTQEAKTNVITSPPRWMHDSL